MSVTKVAGAVEPCCEAAVELVQVKETLRMIQEELMKTRKELVWTQQQLEQLRTAKGWADDTTRWGA